LDKKLSLLHLKRLKDLIKYFINSKTKLNNQYIKSVFWRILSYDQITEKEK